MMNEVFDKERYRDAQNRVRSVINSLDDHDYRTQFHHELSALGWHLAHCLYIENFWLREVLSDDDSLTKGLDLVYLPEKTYKPDRGGKLPELNQLIKLAIEYQSNNFNLLDNLVPTNNSKHLLNNHYLQDFIIQHYDQHYESMQMALQQRAINKNNSDYQVINILSPRQVSAETFKIKKGEYIVGSNDSVCYDNEQPQHTKLLDSFSISKNPVCNNEFLAFMLDDGYQTKTLWSDEGWQWLQEFQAEGNDLSPEHWQKDKYGNWFSVTNKGSFDLEADATVYGINYYEACAYANWSNARLAHEHEWEVAQQLKLLNNTGKVWEWCQNRFYAYPNFKAFPYDNYSMPWFEQAHFVLKGGSHHTQDNIKRASFRNFFGPDKRHVFAGCRLVYDE